MCDWQGRTHPNTDAHTTTLVKLIEIISAGCRRSRRGGGEPDARLDRGGWAAGKPYGSSPARTAAPRSGAPPGEKEKAFAGVRLYSMKIKII